MVKPGLIFLGVGVGMILLLALLMSAGLSSFGPCGPDPFGLVLLLGGFLSCGVGLLAMLMGAAMLASDRIRGHWRQGPPAA
jgi:hypothetical protein